LTVTAASLSYTATGIGQGTSLEGVVTDVDTSGDRVSFNNLLLSNQAEAAQRFTVTTNGENGYQLFVYERQNLLSGSGYAIQPLSFPNDSPNAWPLDPTPSAWGYHTSDETLSGSSPSRFAADDTYARFESSAAEISYSPVPVENTTVDLIYRLEVSEAQEAGEYETEIVYILVPTF